MLPTAQSFPHFRMGLSGQIVLFNLPLGRFFLLSFSSDSSRRILKKKRLGMLRFPLEIVQMYPNVNYLEIWIENYNLTLWKKRNSLWSANLSISNLSIERPPVFITCWKMSLPVGKHFSRVVKLPRSRVVGASDSLCSWADRDASELEDRPVKQSSAQWAKH